MKKRSTLMNLRLKIADLLVGKQTVLFSSKENFEKLEIGDWMDLPDQVLAAATRRWLLAIEAVHRKQADKRDRPVSTMTGQHAVLALATLIRKANAATGEFVIRGSVDGGQTEQIFKVTIEQLDHYVFGTEPVEKEFDPNDPEKLTKLVVRIDNPEYDEWKAERKAERETV